jgi:hypothetical protein
MRNVVSAALAMLVAIPGVSFAQEQSKEELIAIAIEQDACGEAGTVVDAYFREGSSTELVVQCGEPAAELLAGGMNSGTALVVGTLVLLVLAASGGGGGSAIPTTSTN